METYSPIDVPLAATMQVIEDGDAPTGANLGLSPKTLGNGVRSLQNKVAPLVESADIYRHRSRFLYGVAGGDGIAPVEILEGTVERYLVQCTGRSTFAHYEIFPPHGLMLRAVQFRLRVDTTTGGGPGTTPVLVEVIQQNNFSTVDVGGGLGFFPTLTTLASNNDSAADAAAMVVPHTITATVAGSGHEVNRITSRYFVKVRGQSGTGTNSTVKTYYFGPRMVCRVPAGGSIDLGAG